MGNFARIDRGAGHLKTDSHTENSQRAENIARKGVGQIAPIQETVAVITKVPLTGRQLQVRGGDVTGVRARPINSEHAQCCSKN